MGTAGKAFEREKKKFREIEGFHDKAEYLWDYYRYWIIGIIAAIAFIIYMVFHFMTAKAENWLYVMFTNTYAEVGNKSELWEGFEDYAGYDLSEKNLEFNAASYFDYQKNVTGNSYFESFVAYTEAGTLDAVTMEKESLIGLGESGRLLDLDSEECSAIKEKYGDRFIYCDPYDEEYSDEPVAIGIDISDSILMTKYQIYSDSCALGIGANSGHIDAVMKFLDYIFEED